MNKGSTALPEFLPALAQYIFREEVHCCNLGKLVSCLDRCIAI